MLYKKADIELLTTRRIEVLRAANNLSNKINMTEVENQSYEYYKRALTDDSHTAYLVFDGAIFVGAGGVSYFQVMPTYHNPSECKAYIMNMYTKSEYRRKGIANNTLKLLVEDEQSAKQSANQSAASNDSKCKICTLEELAIIQELKRNPAITQRELANAIGKSERTVKTRTVEMQEKGLIIRENGKRNGKWKVLVEI